MSQRTGVVRISSTSDDGKETTLNLMHSGQMFGEVAVLDGQDRTANAIAHEPSELLVIERRDLMAASARWSPTMTARSRPREYRPSRARERLGLACPLAWCVS